MTAISLPANGWRPRPYQRPAWRYFAGGGTRGAFAWHRRAGKDEIALHLTACKAHERVGVYWHMLPEAAQARKAIWEAVNPHSGRRRIDDAFPQELRETTRENEMFIRFRNGSTWQVVGSDNFNSLVGSPPIGLVGSEWSRADPAAWAYLRPILAENGGWAMFISTFFGRNHFYRLIKEARHREGWLTEILPADETGVFTAAQLEEERAEYIQDYGEDEGEALFRQEYLCDPSASVIGSYFGPQMAKAEKDGRITRVPYERGKPVWTGWDLGTNDVTAIWFAQAVGFEPRIIDYYQASNQDVAHYASAIKGKPYAYGGHVLPHDGAERRIQTNKSVQQMLTEFGLSNVITAKRPTNEDDKLAEINVARGLIEKAVFDEEKCERGLEALRNYRREWDDKLKQYKRAPLHDWASDGADAWRTLAVSWDHIEHDSGGHFNVSGFRRQAVA